RGKNADTATGTTAVTQPAGRAGSHHRQTVRLPHPAHTMPGLQAQLPAAV
ncbi:MAG TPA: IS701 family transposase, partial [Acetobacteraceae bacterium]|nr:IS701 family transposase [Acetobacteraceae bacterium]